MLKVFKLDCLILLLLNKTRRFEIIKEDRDCFLSPQNRYSMKKRSPVLYPFSLLYGAFTSIRNWMYDKGFFSSHQYDIPIICIGNISTGGTGKTPHTELVVSMLKDKYNIAVLSRGYRRSSKGFHFADSRSRVEDIGDEPLQIFRKFPDITVAVDADRNRGINTIMKERPEVNLIIMDDGFQHRSVKPGLSIILSDYERLVTDDSLLPYGNLREAKRNLNRADIVVVTKVPRELDKNKKDIVNKKIRRYFQGSLFYSSFVYDGFIPVFPRGITNLAPVITKESKKTGIILITGVANPAPLIEYLSIIYKEVIPLTFADHHTFTRRDIFSICEAFETLKPSRKFIVTTEKDAVRLREFADITPPIQQFIFYIKIDIDFVNQDREQFENKLNEYVGKD